MNQANNPQEGSDTSDYRLTNEKAFDYFIMEHGGNLHQLIATYIRVDIKTTIEKVILGYIDRHPSTIIIYLMLNDPDFIPKIVKFLKK